MKENLQNHFPQSIHWRDGRWKACLAAGGGEKKMFHYCIDASGTIVYCRALQGHPSLQDNVVSPNNFFNFGLIPGGQSSSKRQIVFFLPVDPMDKNHKDPDVLDLSVPRHAQYLHNAWKRHQSCY